MKIGIYGGTFDPPHNGHVNIAKHAIEELHLDKLIVLPAGEPPHKVDLSVTDKYKRLEMCRLAFDDEKMEVSDYEIEKSGKSYTFETLEHFSEPDAELYFVLGGDSLYHLYSWKNPDKIFQLAKLFAVGRIRKEPNDYVEKYNERIIYSDFYPGDVSSTEVRVTNQFEESIDSLVPKKIAEYIKDNDLYSEYRPMTEKLKGMITPHRYVHTMNVAICALNLADSAFVNKKDAFIAATLHDSAKSIKDITPYKKRLERERMFIPAPVFHAFIGSYNLKKEFGVNDKNIENAIKYHTTGRPNMSQLEKLIYVADCIEKGRDYEGVELLRKVAEKDFEKAFVLCLNSSYSVVIDKTMCPLTLDAIDYYGN